MSESKHTTRQAHKRLIIMAALLRRSSQPHVRDAGDLIHELAADLLAGEIEARILIDLVESHATGDGISKHTRDAAELGALHCALEAADLADLRWDAAHRGEVGHDE